MDVDKAEDKNEEAVGKIFGMGMKPIKFASGDLLVHQGGKNSELAPSQEKISSL